MTGWVRVLSGGLFVVGLALSGCAGTDGSTGTDGPAGSSPVASVSVAAGEFRGLQLGVPIPRPSFVLTDDTGASYDFAGRTAGQPTLLFFGYTNCPDVCPTTMADVGVALREVPAELAATVQVVFVTTDPDRDTPPVLAEWLAHFDTDLPTPFVGLTGSIADVEAAQRAAKITVAEDMGQTHSAELQLYGPDDLARVLYTAGSSPDDIAHDLPVIAAG